MTAICIIGTELAAELQDVLIVLQVGALLLFAGVALVQGLRRHGAGRARRSRSSTGSSPFAIDSTSTLVSALLHRRLHLLGLGERGQPDRGDARLVPRARPRRRRLDRDPARHLRRRLHRRRRLRGARDARRVRRRRRDLRRARRRTCSARRSTSSWSSRSSTSAIASTQTTIIPSSRTSFSMAPPERAAAPLRGGPPALPHAVVLDRR